MQPNLGRRSAVASLSCLFSAILPCQDEPKATEHFPVLSYPRDRDRVLAEVDGRPIRLEDLARHIDDRHHPGFREFLATDAGNLLFRSDLPAPWVRHLADIHALRAEAVATGRDVAAADPDISSSLKRSFEDWLAGYVENLRANALPTELNQDRINKLLADYQMKHGLACEMQGLLDFLEPDNYSDRQLYDYFNANARVFGGTVTIAHILIQHRDAGSGILLGEAGRKRALNRIAEVRARLRPDGANFSEVAALMSEDSLTASKGGELANIARFDDRLPAILPRTAWYMKDDEISDVVESQYGYHVIRRLSFAQTRFILFTEDAKPNIRRVMRRHRQEDLLFRVRDKRSVTLHY